MYSYLLTNADWLLRVLIAGICGGAIGYERTRQQKSAGLRTHIVVAVASAVVMIVSKYGFMDIIAHNGVGLDPSRIAAQVVSGISFIGAGTILVKGDHVAGLTTAAGIWATSAIGLCEGAGLYSLGIISTIIIILVQYIFHDDALLNTLISKIQAILLIDIKNTNKYEINDIKQELKKYNAKDISIKVLSLSETNIKINVSLFVKNKKALNKLMVALQNNENIVSIKKLNNI